MTLIAAKERKKKNAEVGKLFLGDTNLPKYFIIQISFLS